MNEILKMIKPLRRLYECICQSSLTWWTVVTLEFRAQIEWQGENGGNRDSLNWAPSLKMDIDRTYKKHIATNQMMHKTYLKAFWHYHLMSGIYAG